MESGNLSYCPGFVTPEQLIEIALTLISHHVIDLLYHNFFVAGSVTFVKNSKRTWQVPFDAGVVKHSHQYLGLMKVSFIVNPKTVGTRCSYVDYYRFEAVKLNSLVFLSAK